MIDYFDNVQLAKTNSLFGTKHLQNEANYITITHTKIAFSTVAPEAVKVRVEPEELKVGIEATLFCDAASSNPPAALSWWRDGIPVQGELRKMDNERGIAFIVHSKQLLVLLVKLI